MTRLPLIALLCLPTLAEAESKRVWHGGMSEPSVVELHEPTSLSAAATLTFRNTEVHSADDVFSLTWDGITVSVGFEFNADGGSERVTVEAPDGYVAVPRSITVPESRSDVIHIVKWSGA